MSTHKHQAVKVTTEGWQYCVRRDGCDGAAHGAVTHTARCRCGAVRRIESNGKHRNGTGWIEPCDPGEHA